MRRSLAETEEVLGKGGPIRSQEGALGSDLTELLDRGSRSQRLKTSPAGIPESQFLGWRPFWPAARNPRQSTKGGRLG